MTDDALSGLPAEFVAVLRDPRVIIPQQASAFSLLASLTYEPPATASAVITNSSSLVDDLLATCERESTTADC
jgi:hypothetical protein